MAGRTTGIGEIYDRIIHLLARFSGMLLTSITLAVTLDVIARKVLNATVIGVVECCEHALVFMTFLSAAWILKQDGHVKVDLILGSLSEKMRALLNLTTSLLGGALSMFISYRGTLTAWDLWQRDIYTAKSLEIPMAPLYTSICIGMFLLSLQFFKNARRHFKNWKDASEAG